MSSVSNSGKMTRPSDFTIEIELRDERLVRRLCTSGYCWQRSFLSRDLVGPKSAKPAEARVGKHLEP